MTNAFDNPSLGVLLQEYFCVRLIAQREASPATIASYRDTFRILLRYARTRLRKEPVQLLLSDIDAPFVSSFLDYLEQERGNAARTRNARFAAIRSFLSFASMKCPTSLPSIKQVLAIPMKRFDREVLSFLHRDEISAILEAPDRTTWSGRRDHALFTTLYNTGARVSEIVNVVVADGAFGQRRCIKIHGKGRKDRVVALWPSTCREISAWVRETKLVRQDPLFPNRRGHQMSRSGVADRLARAVSIAANTCPALRDRSISPHTFRHTTAMHLFQSGVDLTMIAIWLGHESPTTTHMYVEADLRMKKRALDRIHAPKTRATHFKASDAVLAFLDGL